MGVLQEFERRLEGAVEGFFARAFRSGIQPIELAKAIQRYAADAQHVTSDGVVVPNVYRLSVSPRDHDRLEGFGASLPRELAEVVVSTAADRGWILQGPVKVRIDVEEDVRFGRYRLAGRVEAVEDGADGADGANRPRSGRAQDDGRGHGAPAPLPVRRPAVDDRAGIDRTQIVSTVPPSGLQLIVRSGPGAGTAVPVTGQRMTAGRLSSCNVTLQDSTVSREHAAFVRRGETWWVVDLGSTNGTRVNGVQAAEQPIAPGDRVELGDAVVEFVEA